MKYLLTCFCLLFSATGTAADFVFEVPVSLSQLPRGIAQAKINCEVFAEADRESAIGSGYRVRPVRSSHGELTEMICVPVNMHQDFSAAQAHSYRCELLLLTPWARPSWQLPSSTSQWTSLHPKADMPFNVQVEGTIK